MSGALAVSADWSIPQPADIAGAYCQDYLSVFPGCDPYQANTFMSVQARTHGMVGFDLYLYQRALADELMVDKSRAWLQRHADQWGVPQIPAASAIGFVVFMGPANLPLPRGIEFLDGGTQWITTAAGTVGADNTVTIPVMAQAPGTAGNRPVGYSLQIISPVIGLQNQQVIVAAGGLAGGYDAEAPAAWRARILLRIRKRGRCGNRDDYIDWAEASGAAPTPNVIPRWVGPGSVGVVVAMPNPAGADRLVPTAAQVAAIAFGIEPARPVTAQVVVLAAVQRLQPLTIALDPDTVVGRARALAAAAAYLAALPIGGLLRHDRLEGAILQASGADVELITPAGDVQGGGTDMFAAGTGGFVNYA